MKLALLPPFAAALVLVAAAAPAQETVFTQGVDITDSGNLASADLHVNGNTALQGQSCLGFACSDGIAFPFSILTVSDTVPWIRFRDTSPPSPTNAEGDWRLRVGDTAQAGGMERFSIEDLDNSTIPFTVQGNAPSNALWIETITGDIGLGTSLPRADLHIIDGFQPTIRLEQDTSGGNTHAIWEFIVSNNTFDLVDRKAANFPFRIENGAPTSALWIRATGNVGVGTANPAAPLELSRDDAFNFFRITATGAPVNKSVDITFTKGPLNTGELRYNIVDGDGPEMRLNANGDMTLTGKLTTAGPTCGAGCDRVFAPDYPLAGIADHAASMWAAGHLPALGPTVPGAPMNLPEKLGGVINELEHAHIYIAQLHDQLAQAQAREADIADRLARQEALLAAQAADLSALKALLKPE